MRATRTLRKTLDLVASHNEDAALAVMRAAERTGDEVLRQQLLNVIHRLNQDACDLRSVREQLELRRA
ncbi:hypothetical protein DMO17_10285 [Aquipseudomonas alcaligenes]|uniref:Uncharacterized protein n=1 Tax=Aquipseudomonas alcaligenes TaxID=43263 RepID=A0A2V4LIA4_AQUAC|nr:hypothetical protein [Pseudomonas alcaligenes]PYC24460.1 hypothetical protein DMO17_10285 [Pseudomonas alcaligenes]